MQCCDVDSTACWKWVRKRPEEDCWGLMRVGSVSGVHGGKGALEESGTILVG